MALRALYGVIKLKDEASAAVGKLKEAMDEAKKSAFSVQNSLEFMGGKEVASKIIDFGKEISKLMADEEQMGQQVKNLAGDSYGELAKSMSEAAEASKGLMDEGDIQAAVGNAMKFGTSVDFIKNNLSALQQSAAITGEDLTETMQKVSMAAEYGNVRVLRSNPILNNHIEQIKALGTGTDEYTKKAREAMITKIFSEEQVNTGKKYNEVMKLTNSYSKRVENGIDNIKKAWGDLLNTALRPIMGALASFIELMVGTERGMAIVKTAGIALGLIFGVILVAALYSAAAAAWAFVTPLLPFIAIGLAVVAVITAIVLIGEDLYQFFTGGTSVIGTFIDKLKDLWKQAKETVARIWDAFAGKFPKLAAIITGYFEIITAPIRMIAYVIGEIPAIIDWVSGKISSLIDWFKELPALMVSAFKTAKDAIKGFFGIGGGDVNVNATGTEHRASGGRIQANKPYLVGENGAELVTFGSSGNITPNGQLGGGQSINISSLVGSMTFNVNGSAQAATAVKEAVLKALDELSRTTFRAQLGMRTV